MMSPAAFSFASPCVCWSARAGRALLLTYVSYVAGCAGPGDTPIIAWVGVRWRNA